MISILIPTYNYSVVQLVDELHQQAEESGINYEIIVVDDCSTNRSVSKQNRVIEMYSFCRIIRLTENKGRTFARNFLAKEAQYDWLLFLDADVLPKKRDFLQSFIDQQYHADLIFGGICYEEKPPVTSKILRWKYGKERETKTVFQREQNPYLSVISGALFIKKNLFVKTNNYFGNKYGLDVLFTENIKKEKIKVLHIENEVVHLGLENNRKFIEKTKKAMQTIAHLSNQEKISSDHRPIQKAYIKLKKSRCLKTFNFIFTKAVPTIEKNLMSAKPSLFLFDLYRLYYFIQFKEKRDA